MGSNKDNTTRLINGNFLIISTIIKHGILSTAEAEIGSIYLNAKESTVLRTTLQEMGHPQLPAPLQTDNTTIACYNKDTIKQKQTRATEVHFYWVKDRVKQGQFHVYWGPGYQHLADYFMKHHSQAHHKIM
jgi:hypothetical protein